MAVEKFSSNIIGDSSWWISFYTWVGRFRNRRKVWNKKTDTTLEAHAKTLSINDAIDVDFKLMAENPFKSKDKKMMELPRIETQLLRNKLQDIMLKMNEVIDELDDLKSKYNQHTHTTGGHNHTHAYTETGHTHKLNTGGYTTYTTDDGGSGNGTTGETDIGGHTTETTSKPDTN